MAGESAKSGLLKRIQVREIRRTMVKAMDSNKNADTYYAETIANFLANNGKMLCVSPDKALTEMLHDVVITALGMPEESLEIHTNADLLLTHVREVMEARQQLVLLVELSHKNRAVTYLVRQIHNAYPEIKILVITDNGERNAVLANESGVDNSVCKPIDTDLLLGKVALTIRPEQQLTRELEWARTLFAQGEVMQALQVCKKALANKGGSAKAMLLIGDIFRSMKQYDKAVEAYENASKTSAVYMEPLARLADLYAEMGNTRKRLRCLERMDELAPMDVDRKLAIGELYFQMNLADNARNCFDKAVVISKREAAEYMASVSMRMADIYMEKDPETAAGFLQRGLEAKRAYWGKDDLLVFNRLGILLRRAGKWQEAVEEYKKAISIAPHDEGLHYNLGMAYMDGKDYEHARAACLKALGINPDLPRKSANVALNIASVFIHTGDNMHAAPLLRIVLSMDPNNGVAKKMMAQMDQAKQGK